MFYEFENLSDEILCLTKLFNELPNEIVWWNSLMKLFNKFNWFNFMIKLYVTVWWI